MTEMTGNQIQIVRRLKMDIPAITNTTWSFTLTFEIDALGWSSAVLALRVYDNSFTNTGGSGGTVAFQVRNTFRAEDQPENILSDPAAIATITVTPTTSDMLLMQDRLADGAGEAIGRSVGVQVVCTAPMNVTLGGSIDFSLDIIARSL